MFDRVTVLTFDGDRFRCPAGHLIRQFQTKEIGEPAGAHYYVVNMKLYAKERTERQPTPVFAEDRLIVRTDDPAAFVPHTGTAHVYTHCEECRPVLFIPNEGAPDFPGDMVSERDPWCEWALRFAEGNLVEVVPVRVESRDDVRAALRRLGMEVLDDEERLARLHFAAREKRGGRDWMW